MLSIIVPTYNEAKSIGILVGQIARVLGDEEFVAATTSRLQSVSTEIPRSQRTQRTLAEIARSARDRNAAIRTAYATGAFTLKAIGEHFDLHYATVSRIARAANV